MIVLETKIVCVGNSIQSYGYGVQTNNNFKSLSLFLDFIIKIKKASWILDKRKRLYNET